MNLEDAFDQSVDYYDDWMKLALPGFDVIFSTALDLIPFDEQDPIEVLDLGAGTGLFSHHIFTKYPHGAFVLVDFAPKMLNLAKERFQGYPDQFECVLCDYRDFKSNQRFDLVISSLSIHHLPNTEKKTLFHQVYQSLKTPGVFLNVDQVKGPTPYIENIYWTNWLEMVRGKGATEEQIQASIQRRREYDQNATLIDQLRWMADAGFVDVDCVYKDYFIGVFFARKAFRSIRAMS